MAGNVAINYASAGSSSSVGNRTSGGLKDLLWRGFQSGGEKRKDAHPSVHTRGLFFF